MINELMQLSNVLPSGVQGRADKLSVLPGKTVVRVWLTDNGTISNVEMLGVDPSTKLRKYVKDNQHSFPGFNLYVIPSQKWWEDQINVIVSDRSKTDSEKTEILRLLGVKDGDVGKVEECRQMGYGKKGTYKRGIDGLKRNIAEFSSEIRKRIYNQLGEKETLRKLLDAENKIECNLAGFMQQLAEAFVRKGLGIDLKKNVSLFMDVNSYAEYPVSHERTLKRLNELLCESERTVAFHDYEGRNVDAFGLSSAGMKELMRDLYGIPIFKKMKIRASNKDVPAFTRYNLIASDSFPIGSESRERVENALAYITHPENEGYTYGVVSNELLFAYPTEMDLGKKVRYVGMLGARMSSEKQEIATFSEISKQVIDLMKGSGADLSRTDMRIFLLRKMDKARTKVVYSRNVNVSTLVHCSDAWDAGCHNIPSLDSKEWLPHEKGEKAKSTFVEAQTVFPAQMYNFINREYPASLGWQSIPIYKPSVGVELMLTEDEIEASKLARDILARFSHNTQNYFRAICSDTGRGKVSNVPDKNIYLGILGLLLYKVGKRKEIYMEEVSFKLGQFLRVADGLHKCYCDSKREGCYPPELCGSSALVAMMENPVVALSQLALRCAPYVKWAQSCQKGLAHYWLNLWTPLAEALHAAELPVHMNPIDRAEVFLGYLASLPKKEKKEETAEHEKGEQE